MPPQLLPRDQTGRPGPRHKDFSFELNPVVMIASSRENNNCKQAGQIPGIDDAGVQSVKKMTSGTVWNSRFNIPAADSPARSVILG